MKIRTRLAPKIRKKQILETALSFSTQYGYTQLTTTAIADKLSISRALVHYYFGNLENLQKQVIRQAIKRKIFPILVSALIHNHPLSKNIPIAIRLELRKWI